MASIFDYISDTLNRFKFLKWVQIIKTESEATKKSALYLLEKSSTAFEVIVTDDSGAKRKLSGNVNTNELDDLFAKLDASNISPENAELWRGVIIGDLTAYLTKEEAAETYQPKGNYASANHNHSDKANNDASNIDDHIAEWREKLNIQQTEDRAEHGLITTTSNSVTIGLSPLGENFAIIDGVKYIEPTTNPETPKLFTPVTTGQKILIIHAKPDAQVFHLVQGAESTEAVEPAYSGLFVARLLVTDEGIDIVEAVSGFREKSVDNFAIYSLAAGDRILGIGSQMRLKVQSSGAIRIGGFYNKEGKVYNGCPISVRNDTPFDMKFFNAVDASPEFMPINPDDLPFKIKPGETANFAWRGNVAEIIKTGGGASFPEGATLGDVLVEGAEGAEWSGRLTNVESGKLDKPPTDGSWVVTKSGTTITYTDASTFGQNISNSNLTWSADRTQNLNAKKLSFTRGRVSVPALELEITAENSVPNKIWTAGTYLWHTNNLGVSYRVAYDNQAIKTISGDVTLDDTYHNCIVRITANCVITVPTGLRADFNCVFDMIGLFVATFLEGSGITFSSPFGNLLKENAMCTLYKVTSSNFRLNGGLLPV